MNNLHFKIINKIFQHLLRRNYQLVMQTKKGNQLIETRNDKKGQISSEKIKHFSRTHKNGVFGNHLYKSIGLF